VSVLVRVRASLGFRDRVMVRVKVRVSFRLGRLATFMYSVWPPVSLFVYTSRVEFFDLHKTEIQIIPL